MCRTRSLFIAYCLFCASIAASLGAVKVLDLEFVHFEDGSGKVSWCLPAVLGGICSQE